MADWDPFADPADGETSDPPVSKHPEPTVLAEVPAAAAAETVTSDEKGAEKAEPPASAEKAGENGLLPGEVKLQLGDIVALHTFPEGEKATWGVLIAGGNPSKEFGGATMHSPVLEELCKALDKEGLHRLRFDYPGSGMSGGTYPFGGEKASITAVMEHMLEHFCRCLVYVGYSMGSQIGIELGMKPQFRPKVKLIVALSTGFMVWKWLSDGDYTSTVAQELEKSNLKPHTQSDHPILYVFGDKDRMTPEGGLRDLLKQRSDGGEDAKVHKIAGGDHPFKGHELEVVAAVMDYLREEM